MATVSQLANLKKGPIARRGQSVTPEHKQVLSKTMAKTAANCKVKGIKWGGGGKNKGIPISEQTRDKISKGLHKAIREGRFTPENNAFKHCHSWVDTRFGAIHCVSSWEVRRLQTLENDSTIILLEKDKVRIPYKDPKDGRSRTYIVDFLLKYSDGRTILEEIKPEDRCSEPESLAKFEAASLFAESNQMEFRVIKLWRVL